MKHRVIRQEEDPPLDGELRQVQGSPGPFITYSMGPPPIQPMARTWLSLFLGGRARMDHMDRLLTPIDQRHQGGEWDSIRTVGRDMATDLRLGELEDVCEHFETQITVQ
jgi:hypothetical protein